MRNQILWGRKIEEKLYYYKATCIRVIDGDTIELNIDLGFNTWHKSKVRLARINTPEVYSVKKDSDEYNAGIKASRFVHCLLQGKEVIIMTGKDAGKYGRWIAEIYLNNKNINDLLVEKGLATYYKE